MYNIVYFERYYGASSVCVCLNPVLSQPRQKSLNMWARSDNVIGLGITVDQKCQALVELDDDYGIDSIDNDDDNDALREVNARGGVGDGSAGAGLVVNDTLVF